MSRGPKETFLKKNTYKKVLIVPIMKEMQIKTTMRCHLTPVRMAIINRLTNRKFWQEYRAKGTLMV